MHMHTRRTHAGDHPRGACAKSTAGLSVWHQTQGTWTRTQLPGHVVKGRAAGARGGRWRVAVRAMRYGKHDARKAATPLQRVKHLTPQVSNDLRVVAENAAAPRAQYNRRARASQRVVPRQTWQAGEAQRGALLAASWVCVRMGVLVVGMVVPAEGMAVCLGLDRGVRCVWSRMSLGLQAQSRIEMFCSHV